MRSFLRATLLSSLLAAPVAGFACSSGSDTGNAGPATGTGTGTGTGTASTSSATGTGGAGGAGGSGATGTAGTAGTAGTTGSGPPVIVECQTHVYACGDTMDNDADGLIDAADPDCLGPCDNTEGSFFGGIPGDSGPACLVDCYFDQDSGAGNDDCYWNHKCDEHEQPPSYYPESENGAQCAFDPNANTPGTSGSCDELYATQSQACLDYCGPLTPNGCDCFGCCELPAGGGEYVWLGSESGGMGTCTIAELANPDMCQPCKPVAACLNDCGTCELCIGKTELPPECFPPDGGSTTTTGTGAGGGDPGSQCPDGVQPCGLPGQDPCPGTHYCITGCCIEAPG